MSKSNLKNINKLSSSKKQYLLYVNSSYANLLYKLKKSSIWIISKNKWTSVFYIKDNNNYNILVNWDYWWDNYRLYKTNCINYNPNPLITLDITVEIKTQIRYKHIDIDILNFLIWQEKKKIRLKKQLKYKNNWL